MKALRFIFWGLLLCALLALAGGVYLISPAGLRRVTPWLENQVSQRVQATVTMEGLTLKWPLALGLDRLQIADASHVYLDVQDLHARISARRLLRRFLWIHRFHIGHVLYTGWPAEAADANRESVEPPLDWSVLEPVLSAFIVSEGAVDAIRLDAPVVSEPVEARLSVRWAKGPARKRELEVHLQSNLGHTRIQGGWDPDTTGLHLAAQVDVPDLEALEPWWGQSVVGALTLNVLVEGPVDQPAWDVQAESEIIAWNEQVVSSLALTLAGQNVWQPQSGTLQFGFVREETVVDVRTVYHGQESRFALRELQARVADVQVDGEIAYDTVSRDVDIGLRAVGPHLDEGTLKVTGDARQTDWMLKATGQTPSRWSTDFAGQVRWEEGKPSALIWDVLRAQWGEWDVFIEAPFRLTVEEDSFKAEPFRLRVGEGLLTMHGVWHPEQLDFKATVQDVPLSLFGFAGVSPDQGRMKGTFALRGHPAQPEASLALDFSDILPANPDLWAGPPARFTLESTLAGQRLNLEARLHGLPGDPVEGDWSMPLDLALYPFALTWPPEGPVSGRLDAQTDLAELAALFVVDAHRLAGKLTVQLLVAGTWDEPVIEGAVQVRDGVYENARTGTMLLDVAMDLVGAQDRLRLDHFHATDGEQGRLTAQGQADFAPGGNVPFTASAQWSQFRLAHNDTFSAVGHGELSWQGNRAESALTGLVRVYPVELRIPERLPPNIIPLDVIELDGPEVADVEEVPALDHALQLNVQVELPDRFFVRGRGLDSEWGGALSVRGTAKDPVIAGHFSVLRGRFVFLGKRLALTRGMIMLDGSYPPAPQLDLLAEARSGGITAMMRLTGPVDGPSIELDSVPAMPEDEILARLLFGREATRITPFQALTMAQAVNRLRGGGHAFDVMGETRRRLGVDQIEIRDRGEEEGALTLNVGKYVSDRIYVELERGLNAEGGRALVEVELSPRLRLESEVGVNAEGGLGLVWTWDY